MVRFSIFALMSLLPLNASAQGQPRVGDTLFVADRFINGPGTVGARMVAKFTTAAMRANEFRLDAEVAVYKNRKWLLDDILVSVDFNANGSVATWTVAGPKSVIDAHVAHLRELALDRSKVYDHGIRFMFVKCNCD